MFSNMFNALHLIILILIFSFYSCTNVKAQKDSTLNVGAIAFDNRLDDKNFKICDTNNILEYYNFGKGLQYEGEKIEIDNFFKDKLKSVRLKNESGYLTIRFIVNCKGEVGCFRTSGMDTDLRPKYFNKSTVKKILEISKKLKGWKVGVLENILFDYYQHLTFKIKQGKVEEILP